MMHKARILKNSPGNVQDFGLIAVGLLFKNFEVEKAFFSKVQVDQMDPEIKKNQKMIGSSRIRLSEVKR